MAFTLVLHKLELHHVSQCQPFPINTLDANGLLLLRKGYVIESQDQLKLLVERGLLSDEQAFRAVFSPQTVTNYRERSRSSSKPTSGSRSGVHLVRHEIRPPPSDPWRRTAPSESQEVLRRGASETGFRASRPEAQSGAQSKKPRVVRGSSRLTTRLSELAGLVLAGQKRLFN
jgi:hypothetical protein